MLNSKTSDADVDGERPNFTNSCNAQPKQSEIIEVSSTDDEDIGTQNVKSMKSKKKNRKKSTKEQNGNLNANANLAEVEQFTFETDAG